MFGLSLTEIVFLAILALIVIGPKQLPEVARTLGRMLNELRRASSSLTNELRQHVKIDSLPIDEVKAPPPVPSATPETKSEDSEVKNHD
ncbi:MAG TPA: twin-arginine translocase TatA/TatE family subunit [Pseudobdellovibrionaceae bacterium]|jgi:sec-independent protein translocase protein TatB